MEAELWATGVSTTTMSAAELAAYEEKKLKMRKAMGENLGDAVPGETRDAAQRRCRLIPYQDVPTAFCQKCPPYNLDDAVPATPRSAGAVKSHGRTVVF